MRGQTPSYSASVNPGVIKEDARGSGPLALRAPERFKFGLERRPEGGVLGLFGAHLGVERFAQGLTEQCK